MKVLCKINKENEVAKIKKNKIYYIIDQYKFGCIIYPGGKKRLTEEYWLSNKFFDKYFYSIEETSNILRTKLIDKILNDN